MIQVYADGALVYDSRLEEYDLVGLKVTTGLNVGGTAEIVMPVGHPAYNSFVSHKTIVTIYRDGVLRFRGRALYPADNFLGQRTITCEGELCLLRDSINRPYKYQASPRSIFVTLINAHNGQTDAEKKFKVGDVTVVDPNDYILLESESAETILDTLNKAVERVGGYVTFTDAEDGSRVINWLETMDSRSDQVIELGENLLDFSRTGANTTALMTGLVPYGAKNEATKKRLTIESVNGGKDYILANDAKAVRGTIMGTATWDDVTVASNLLKKAQAYLEQSKLFITSLNLTALDLSYMDKSLDSFSVGDEIRVLSAPHGVDEYFQLTQLTEDLLNPAQSRITLGKDVQSLTGADVANDKKGQSALTSVRVQLDNGQDLTGYVKQDDLVGYATQDDLVLYIKQDELADYVKQDELNLYVQQGDLSGYAKKTDLTGFATTNALGVVSGAVNTEVAARKKLIGPVDGDDDIQVGGGADMHVGDADHVTHLYGGDRIKVHGRMHMMDSMLDFSNNQGVRIYNNDGNVYYIVRVDASNNTFVGTDSNNLYLRGPVVYLRASNTVVTSDERQKNSIEELPDAYVDMLDKLTPVRFKYNDGQSGRYHVGFIAQDVENALKGAGLTTQDFGGFVDLDGDGEQLGLAYDEFIGLLFQKIRKLEKKIEAMEESKQ